MGRNRTGPALRQAARAPCRTRHAQQGQALFAVVVVAAVTTVSLGAFGLYIGLQDRSLRLQARESRAFYLAESGLQRAIGDLQQRSHWESAQPPGPGLWPELDPDSRIVVSYLSTGKSSVTVSASGEVQAAGDQPASVTLQATLSKVPVPSLWNYAAYAARDQDFGAEAHGSVFAGQGDIQIGSASGVLNDWSGDPAALPGWLLSHFANGVDSSPRASVAARAGDILVSGEGRLGTAAAPLDGVGIQPSRSVNVADYYLRVFDPGLPPAFPDVAANQLDGDVSPPGEYDYRAVASDLSNPDHGCVWDTEADTVTDGSRGLSLTFGGDVPSCRPYSSNGIVWLQTEGKLVVNGTVFIDGDLTIGDSTFSDIVYEGRGLLVVNGTVSIRGGLHPAVMDAFPAAALLEIVTPNGITIDPPDAQPYQVVAGAFFAGESVHVEQGAILVGSACAGQDVVTTGHPVLYHAPALSANLLPGTPDFAASSFAVRAGRWRRG